MLWFTGDINFCDGYFDAGIGTGSLIRNGHNPFKFLPVREGDLWVGNFEGVCSDVSELEGVAADQFIISPRDLTGIWHPDVYGVANNHVMQHGREAYSGTESYGKDELLALTIVKIMQ